MPDYKDEPAGVETMMPWSDFIKERCSGVMGVMKEKIALLNADLQKVKRRNPCEKRDSGVCGYL